MPAIIEAYICEAKLICILCIAFVTGGASIGAKHEALASGAVMLLLHSARHKLQTGGRLHCTSLLTLSFAPFVAYVCVCACGVGALLMRARLLVQPSGLSPLSDRRRKTLRASARFNLLLCHFQFQMQFVSHPLNMIFPATQHNRVLLSARTQTIK